MPKLLATFSFHHDSPRSGWSQFVESEAEALDVALDGGWGVEMSEDVEASRAEAARAIKEADEKFAALPEGPDNDVLAKTCSTLQARDRGYGGSFEDEDDVQTFVVWRHRDKDGALNWGVGESGEGGDISDTDKRENVWIKVDEWEPKAERKAELEALSKEELVQKLLEMEATR